MNADRTWEMARAEVVWETVGLKSKMTYIGRLQETVTHSVALRPIFEVCAGETSYEGGGCRREVCWRQGDAVQ